VLYTSSVTLLTPICPTEIQLEAYDVLCSMSSLSALPFSSSDSNSSERGLIITFSAACTDPSLSTVPLWNEMLNY
jgi:hypothetical protein